jgi:alcohol dehydrogenase, propanol-preferring
MRAMMLAQAKPVEQAPLELRDVPIPQAAAGEVRLRVQCCGICHTDLHTVEGELHPPALPIIPGHQVVGIVDALGPGTKLFREGDRLGIPWLNSTDGTCHFCQTGRENLCDHARFTGLDVNGGYAEYVVVREDFAVPLPPAVPDAHLAPLLCAGIIGYRSYRLSNAQRGDRLGIFGFGAAAHIIIQVARHLGHEVYVFTRADAHRALARSLGAAWAGDASEAVDGILDSAIIFAPAGALVPVALRTLRKGGTLALGGIYMSDIPSFPYANLYHERTVRSVANSTRQDAHEFLQLAAEANVQTTVQVFPLEQANQALLALKESRIEGAGVLRLT